MLRANIKQQKFCKIVICCLREKLLDFKANHNHKNFKNVKNNVDRYCKDNEPLSNFGDKIKQTQIWKKAKSGKCIRKASTNKTVLSSMYTIEKAFYHFKKKGEIKRLFLLKTSQ